MKRESSLNLRACLVRADNYVVELNRQVTEDTRSVQLISSLFGSYWLIALGFFWRDWLMWSWHPRLVKCIWG
jgi:hypothetical protein